MYDTIIIGAGPIGLAAGIEAEKAGLRYLIIEKGVLVNSIYHYPVNMTFFSTSDKLEIGGVPFISHNYKPTRAEALEYYRRVAMKWNLNISLYEKTEEIEKVEGGFSVRTEKRSLSAKNVIIATGFYDAEQKLNIPGEELEKVKHYYDDPHPYFRQKVAVIGSANSAVDAALETWRKGADVTMIIRENEISKRVKYWVRPDIINRIEEGSIRAYFESEVSLIEKDHIEFTEKGKIRRLENDFVLALTGYRPDFEMLKSAGVHFQNDEYHTPVYDEKSMESNVEGLYLAGVVCGGLNTHVWFIENSRIHAERIVQSISAKSI
jgi:putative YpdA family bacillithiol system oxidoreductase